MMKRHKGHVGCRAHHILHGAQMWVGPLQNRSAALHRAVLLIAAMLLLGGSCVEQQDPPRTESSEATAASNRAKAPNSEGSRSPSTRRRCNARNLRLIPRWGAALGSFGGTWLVLNEDPWLCRLEGRLRARVTGPSGRVLAADMTESRAVVLDRFEFAEAIVLWSNWCGERRGPFSVEISLPHHRGVLKARAPGPATCTGAKAAGTTFSLEGLSGARLPEVSERPRCRAYQLGLTTGEEGGAMNGSTVGVVVELVEGPPCRLSLRVNLALRDVEGNLLSVRGSPASATLNAALPEDYVSAVWLWRNWCGEPGPFVIEATERGLVGSSRMDSVGTCWGKRWPSTLVRIGD